MPAVKVVLPPERLWYRFGDLLPGTLFRFWTSAPGVVHMAVEVRVTIPNGEGVYRKGYVALSSGQAYVDPPIHGETPVEPLDEINLRRTETVRQQGRMAYGS